MKTAILKGLSDAHKEEMRQTFNGSAFLRQQLIKLLNEKIDASNRLVRSKDAYSVPNWAYLQADAVGYERALIETINLLSSESTDAIDLPITPPAAEKPKRKYTRKVKEITE